MRFMFATGLALMLALTLALSGSVAAQPFTTADAVRPILSATKGNWISLREYGGHDLMYFTHLSSFRCGLREIRFGINTDFAALPFQPEPCYRDEATPNALKLPDGALPYVTFPPGAVPSVSVVISYDDGTEDTATHARAAILSQQGLTDPAPDQVLSAPGVTAVV